MKVYEDHEGRNRLIATAALILLAIAVVTIWAYFLGVWLADRW